MNTKSQRFVAARAPGKTRMVAGFPFKGDPDYDSKKVEKNLRGRGVIDRNGFPILDPPGARNRLPRRCHERLHTFKVTKSTDLNEYDHKTGKSLYKVEKVCVNCQHVDTETRWV